MPLPRTTQSVREPRLNGDYFLAQAAYFEAHGWSFGVWNLASGRNTYTYEDGFDWETYEAVDMEVGIHGGVAWIEPWKATVTKVDSGGRTDIGRSDRLEPRTESALTVNSDTVSWRSQGTLGSYLLNAAAQ